MLHRALAAIFLFSSLVHGQSIDAGKVATVHVYRADRQLIAASAFADGKRVAALAPHKSATFYLLPGYHELIMQSGEVSPAATLKAVAGNEYFFRLDYEPVVSATSRKQLSVTLSMEPRDEVLAQK